MKEVIVEGVAVFAFVVFGLLTLYYLRQRERV